jgi:hypothetical protein
MTQLIKLYNSIFTDEEEAYSFLVRAGKLPGPMDCICGNECALIRDRTRITGFFFRCTNNRCKKKYAVCDVTWFGKQKVYLREQLKVIYMWVAGFDTVQTESHCEISMKTAYEIGCNVVGSINIESFGKIGATDVAVLLDETQSAALELLTILAPRLTIYQEYNG